MNEYESYSDTVLYDVFYEAGTMLLGTLNHIENLYEERGDLELSKWAAEESVVLMRDRQGVDPFDRDEQISMIKRWKAQRSNLRELLEPTQKVFAKALASA